MKDNIVKIVRTKFLCPIGYFSLLIKETHKKHTTIIIFVFIGVSYIMPQPEVFMTEKAHTNTIMTKLTYRFIYQ